VVVPLEAMIEREPVTVVCSQMGWIRAVRGHVPDPSEMKYKEGDGGRFVLHAQTTDRLVLFATNGRFYTVGCDKLPGGRGHGEPLRLMIDLPNEHDVVRMFVHHPDRRLVVASDSGRAFQVEEHEVIAQTRNGKQVVNLGADERAVACAPVVEGADAVAVVGDNRKLLIFRLDELPVLARGRGVIAQRYRQGGRLADITTLTLKTGLTWHTGANRTRTETGIAPWLGKRGQAGRLAPKGFSRAGGFG